MNVKQISVFLDNRPGTILEMSKLFAQKQVNVKAMTVMDANDFTVVRLIVDNVMWASSVLRDGGFITRIREVVAAEVPFAPDGLNKVLTAIRDADVNIDYSYTVMSGKFAASTCIILKVNDNVKAVEALQSAGVKIMTQEELSAL